MAATDYTDKQYAEHLARFAEDGTLPDGSVFDAGAERRGGRIIRKLTAEERRARGLVAEPARRAADDDDPSTDV